MHYVYDFDHTLFATHVLWECWLDELVKHSFDREEAAQAGQVLFSQGFTLEKHASSLGMSDSAVKKMMKSFGQVHDRLCAKLVFEDVLPFLESQNEKGIRQSVLTFGDSDYQHRKLHISGLVEHLDDVRVANPDKRKVAHLRELIEAGSEPITYFDDNPEKLLAIYEAGLPITLIRMLRDGGKHSGTEHIHDDEHWQCIRGLEELNEEE